MTAASGIIDVHCHVHSAEDPETETAELLRLADRAGVRQVCMLSLSSLAHTPAQSDIRRGNDIVRRLRDRWPDRVIPFVFLNGRHSVRFNEAEMERCIVRHGFRGVKLIISLNARRPELDPILRRAADLDVPVLHHAWYKTVQKYPEESDPSDIAHLARRHPETQIIMAHLTAAGQRGVLDIAPCSNVAVDTSGSQAFSEIVEYAVAHLGAHRVLFGSDEPGRDLAVQLGRIHGAALSGQDRDMILSGNARRLLHLNRKD